jgi:hypothetical protein
MNKGTSRAAAVVLKSCSRSKWLEQQRSQVRKEQGNIRAAAAILKSCSLSKRLERAATVTSLEGTREHLGRSGHFEALQSLETVTETTVTS